MTSATGPLRPLFIDVKQGYITKGSGTGKGLCIDSGRDSNLQFLAITTTDTNVTIGPIAMVSGNITLDGNGAEAAWTWAVDATSSATVPNLLMRKSGDPVDGKMSLSATPGDGTVLGGNGRGPSSVDLQISRTAANQVATGLGSVIGGGQNNTAAGTSVVAGGSTNTATGNYNAVPGGLQANDRGRYGSLVYASGQLLAQGDAQLSSMIMRRVIGGQAPIQLTTSGGAPGATTCMNIPDNTAFGFSIRLHARDFTTAGKDYDWFVPNAMLTRDTGAASTALALGTPVTLTRGTVAGAVAAAVADTTNGCLNLSFQPPTGNADSWHAVARIEAVVVQ
jgi:hypothetical protein